ncbi:MAG: hypothetical protein ACYC01_09830 [Lutibacter sp.]
MKKLFRILGIILLTALYFAAISFDGRISQNEDFTNKSASEKENTNSTVSVKLFSNTSQAESLANPYSNTPPITFKNSFNEFLAIVKITEQFFANEFVQYISISKNFRIKYRKANIIFPFHYFW